MRRRAFIQSGIATVAAASLPINRLPGAAPPQPARGRVTARNEPGRFTRGLCIDSSPADDQSRVKANDVASCDPLVRLRATLDLANRLRLNSNIKPAGI